MSYMALYRKFRPGEFDEVKGQDHIVTTLKNQISAGRTGHAYLFCGTRGTGKTTVAKILAKAVNCENPVDGSPCGTCDMCVKIQNQTSMNVIEIDAASNNGVGNVRDIIEEVQYSPTEGNYKVYIIDEVHMLSTSAFNALLKTLEEPPEYVKFILATTEAHKIPITILSRCQRYDFKRISVDTIAARLKDLVERENIQAEDKALRYVARMGDGSMRDALSLLDQCIAFYFGKELTYDRALEVLGAVDTKVYSEMFHYIIEGETYSCINLINDMLMMGRDLNQFISELIWYLRGLLLIEASDDVGDILDVSSERLAQMQQEAQMVSEEQVMRYIRILSELSNSVRYSTQKRVLTEVTFIKLCKPQMDSPQDLSSIINRLDMMERKLENGDFVQNAAVPVNQGAVAPQSEPQVIEKIIPKAIPEEVQEVANRWQEVMAEFGYAAKPVLENFKKTVDDQGALLLQTASQPDYEYVIQDDGAILHMIEKVIRDKFEKEVTVHASCVDQKMHERVDDIASAFQGKINFDIEVVDEGGN